MRILLTGGTGFIGKWLVKELAKRNNETILFTINEQDKPIEFSEFNNIHYYVCPLDKLDSFDCNLIKKDGDVDVFVHLAWVGTSGSDRSNDTIQLNNIKYACSAVKLASRLGAKKFINAGSIMEYEAFYTITSEKPSYPNMMYSIGKLSQDLFSKTIANGLNITYCNLIIGNIYGVGEKSQRFLNTIVRKMMRNEKIELTDCEQLYDFIYAEDAVAAICSVIEKGNNNCSYYIGNDHPKKLKEYIFDIKRITNSNSEIVFGAVPYLNKALSYTEFDMAKIHNTLGFKPKVSFEEGIKMMQEWIELENE